MTGSSDTLGNFPFLAIETFGGGFFLQILFRSELNLFVCLFLNEAIRSQHLMKG